MSDITAATDHDLAFAQSVRERQGAFAAQLNLWSHGLPVAAVTLPIDEQHRIADLLPRAVVLAPLLEADLVTLVSDVLVKRVEEGEEIAVRPSEDPESTDSILVVAGTKDKEHLTISAGYSIGDGGHVTWEEKVTTTTSHVVTTILDTGFDLPPLEEFEAEMAVPVFMKLLRSDGYAVWLAPHWEDTND